jgi:hypothetical protein
MPEGVRTNRGEYGERLLELLGSGGATDLAAGTLVVIPSITFPEPELRKIVGIQYYEERMLFFLLLLRNPNLRIVYPTSLRVEEPIVDYYLRFLPRDVRAGDRLYLLALWDQEARALTEKLLENEWATERLEALSEGDSLLVTFNVTRYEQKLADRIGVPLYGCPLELVGWGFKTGSRRIAKEAGIRILEGSEDLWSVDHVERALFDLKEMCPDALAAVVKLNEGFSGQGNVIIELKTLRSPLRLAGTVFCAREETWTSFAPKIREQGAIVERLVTDPESASPSVQLRVAPDGSCEVISTHDQILGGPDQQVYLGCRFPADPRYRLRIQEAGMRIAEVLSKKGIIGSFGADFVVMPGEHPDIFLSEINMRLGGTTHTFVMTKLVTGGSYDPSTGDLMVDGKPKYYVSTDNLKSERYIGLLPEQLIGAIDDAGLAFDPQTNTGVTLHLLGALKRFGKFGLVCIADSNEEADLLHDRVLEVADGFEPQPEQVE